MNLPYVFALLTSQSQKKTAPLLSVFEAVLGKIQDALIVPSNYMYSAWELGIIQLCCDSPPIIKRTWLANLPIF